LNKQFTLTDLQWRQNHASTVQRKRSDIPTAVNPEFQDSQHCQDAWAIDKGFRGTIYVRRRGESAMSDAGWEALLDL
jgi:hypothetical protein